METLILRGTNKISQYSLQELFEKCRLRALKLQNIHLSPLHTPQWHSFHEFSFLRSLPKSLTLLDLRGLPPLSLYRPEYLNFLLELKLLKKLAVTILPSSLSFCHLLCVSHLKLYFDPTIEEVDWEKTLTKFTKLKITFSKRFPTTFEDSFRKAFPYSRSYSLAISNYWSLLIKLIWFETVGWFFRFCDFWLNKDESEEFFQSWKRCMLYLLQKISIHFLKVTVWLSLFESTFGSSVHGNENKNVFHEL